MNKEKWKNIRWIEVQKQLLRQQRRVYKASKEGLNIKMHIFQRRLINSFEAKLVAVQCAIESLNERENLAHISPTQKMMLVYNLKIDGNMRDSFISKSIDPIKALELQAQQNLAKLALEPQWEAFFESNRSSFWLTKSHYDSTQKILSGFKQNKPQWVFVVEFANVSQINHSKLLAKLATFSEMEKQIKTWLNKGILINFEKSPDLLGQFMQKKTSDTFGSFLINVAFHGLETTLQNEWQFMSESTILKKHECPLVTIVQHTTSFAITASDQTIFDVIIKKVDVWFQKEVGVFPSKKRIVFSTQGFDFLGFQFISIKQQTGDYRLKIKPSKKSKQRFIQRTRQLIQTNKSASSYTLIRLLSRPVLGWANYFYFSECRKDFAQLDSVLFHQIRAWVFRRTSKGLSSRTKLKQKYFPEGKCYFFQGKWYQHNWILNGQTKNQNGQSKTLFLPKMTWITVTRFKFTKKIKDL